MTVNLHGDFQQRVRDVHGPAGEAWLHRLPVLLDEAAARWSLRLLPPFEPLSYNYVAPAVCADGREVVLKAGVPGRLRRSEIAALRAFDGRGAVLLLDADPDAGLMLLDRLRPGTTLAQADLPEEAATSAAAAGLRALRRPAPPVHDFPTVEGWGAGFTRLRARFEGGAGPLPPRLVEQAERLYAGLCASAGKPILLHGDLHHDNILAADRAEIPRAETRFLTESGFFSTGWLAIDPQGVIGEPAYETGALLRNPFPAILSAPDARSILARRAAQLAAELGFDRQRVRGWAFAQAVLSAIWEVEDHGGDVRAWIAVAELLRV